MQDRTVAGQDGCRAGWIEDMMDAEQDVCRTGQIRRRTGRMQDNMVSFDSLHK